MTCRPIARDVGFVLPNVLIYIGALSAIALALLGQLDRSASRIELARSAAQAGLIADAGVSFVIALLEDDAARPDGDHFDEPWALRDYRLETEGGDAIITVEDMQSRININLIVTDPLAATAFRAASREAGVAGADGIIGVFGGWIAPPGTNVEGRGGGAAFLPDDVMHLAELAVMTGTTPADIARLQGFATALPRDRRVNVNTADPDLLAFIVGDVTADRLEAARPIASLQDMTAEIAASNPGLPQDAIEALTTVSSAWFCAKIVVRLDQVDVTRNTILHRDTETGAVRVMSHRDGRMQDGC